MFALQNGGWCGSSAPAPETYNKYGEANNCAGGKGGPLTNDVYWIKGESTILISVYLYWHIFYK